MKRIRERIGDIIEIHVHGKYYCYAQIIPNDEYAFFVFKTDAPLKYFSVLDNCKILFVICVYRFALKEGIWRIVGTLSYVIVLFPLIDFMNGHIRYGWLDIDNEEHIGNMKNFRRLYRTSNIEEVLKHGLGTCIEQVMLMHYLLDRINVENKMFCTRVYEGRDFNNLEAEEHMHCFILYYMDGKVYQLEHPNWEKIGIHEYATEEDAINEINDYYVKMAEGKSRPVTEFYEVKPGLSFKEFNEYINSLDGEISYANITIG